MSFEWALWKLTSSLNTNEFLLFSYVNPVRNYHFNPICSSSFFFVLQPFFFFNKKSNCRFFPCSLLIQKFLSPFFPSLCLLLHLPSISPFHLCAFFSIPSSLCNSFPSFFVLQFFSLPSSFCNFFSRPFLFGSFCSRRKKLELCLMKNKKERGVRGRIWTKGKKLKKKIVVVFDEEQEAGVGSESKEQESGSNRRRGQMSTFICSWRQQKTIFSFVFEPWVKFQLGLCYIQKSRRRRMRKIGNRQSKEH